MPCINFDANTVEPNTAPELLNPGDYEVVIVESDLVSTKAGDGKILKFVLQVYSGPCKNSKLYDNLNLYNPNDKAVEIARGTLSAICRAVGVMTPTHSEQLHFKPMIAKLKIEKGTGGYNDKNKIVGYRSCNPQIAKPVTPKQAEIDRINKTTTDPSGGFEDAMNTELAEQNIDEIF